MSITPADSKRADYENGDEHSYVSLIVDDRKLLLTRRSQCERLTLPEFKAKRCSSSFASCYLKELCQNFGIDGTARVVLEQQFEEYEESLEQFVSLVIVEVASADVTFTERFVCVDWKEALEGEED